MPGMRTKNGLVHLTVAYLEPPREELLFYFPPKHMGNKSHTNYNENIVSRPHFLISSTGTLKNEHTHARDLL
jgi:hypothetical protein